MDVLVTLSVVNEYKSKLQDALRILKDISMLSTFNCIITDQISREEIDIFKQRQGLSSRLDDALQEANSDFGFNITDVDDIDLKSLKINKSSDEDNFDESTKEVNALHKDDIENLTPQTEIDILKRRRMQLKMRAVKEKTEKVSQSQEWLPTACEVCAKIFRNKPAYREHFRRMHLGLKRHRKRPNGTVCDQCGKTFLFSKPLLEHKFIVHDNGSKDFKCDQCDASFYFDYKLEKHKRLYHSGSKFPCEYCGKIFPLLRRLEEHVKRFHKKIKHYNCSECEKSFFKNSLLKNHMANVHIKSYTIPCDHCDKVFPSQDRKRGHVLRYHKGDYRCKICGEDMKNDVRLQDHINKHLKKYVCPICQIPFGQKFKLERHLKTHKNP